MKDLIDLKAIWVWMVERWRTSFAAIALAVLAFFSGAEWGSKQITDDCKFMGTFRDGPQAYTCNPRVR
jgi:hypothetical protein